jgi:hypothetical protein
VAGIGLAISLALASGGLWAWWATNEYRGLNSCPFGLPGHGHPLLVALALTGASAVIMFLPRWGATTRRRSITLGVTAALLGGVVIYVAAFFVAGGLRCFD